MVGQAPMSVVAAALLFSGFVSCVADPALTESCMAPAAFGSTFHRVEIVAVWPAPSGPMLQGKLPVHAPALPSKVSPGDAAAVTPALTAVSGPRLRIWIVKIAW